VFVVVVGKVTIKGLGMAVSVLRATAYEARGSHRDVRYRYLAKCYASHMRLTPIARHISVDYTWPPLTVPSSSSS
jgi:hypothetical protein